MAVARHGGAIRAGDDDARRRRSCARGRGRADGVERMVFLPGDIPLVTAGELDIMLQAWGEGAGPQMTIAPAILKKAAAGS